MNLVAAAASRQSLVDVVAPLVDDVDVAAGASGHVVAAAGVVPPGRRAHDVVVLSGSDEDAAGGPCPDQCDVVSVAAVPIDEANAGEIDGGAMHVQTADL